MKYTIACHLQIDDTIGIFPHKCFQKQLRENITYIHRDMRGLDRDHRPFVVGYEKPKMITSPVLAIYFDSYGAKEYK